MNSPPSADPQLPHHAEHHGSIRRFVQILLSFFCWFLVVRTMALEPFGVLTGSMAPAFLGIHRELPCSRCGYAVRVGEPGPNARPVRFTNCLCPNCGNEVDLSKINAIVGDRLMVDKTAFQLRRPRRWEAAVFRCPADLSKPYVKRVAGLPNETLTLQDGDLYIDGELARKTLDQFRELRIPVFDLDYPPQPSGWRDRWEEEPLADPKLPKQSRPPGKPIDPHRLQDGQLILDGLNKPEGIGLTYKHINLDRHVEEPIGDWLTYNGGANGPRDQFGKRTLEDDAVHDFSVVFELEVLGGSGSFACRLADGGDTVLADFPINRPGQAVQIAHDGGRMASGQALSLTTGQRYQIEFAFVDRRVSLSIDGDEVIPAMDLPVRQKRGAVQRPLQFGCLGPSLVIRHLKLYRDVHYLAVGKAAKRWTLGPEEYFFLGDNSSNSDDSRTWKINGEAAPAVPLANFIGKPFFIHQPMRAASFSINGKTKAIQTLDWSRIRWVR